MIDMLVRLYDLPPLAPVEAAIEKLSADDIIIRRPGAYEKHLVAAFIQEHFSPKWVSEFEVSMSRQPASCWIATHRQKVIGFACYETTAKGFFGPTGVDTAYREKGLGKTLLLKSLHSLKELGYAYGFIGGVGPQAFYEKACNATVIENSTPGIYQDILPEPSPS